MKGDQFCRNNEKRDYSSESKSFKRYSSRVNSENYSLINSNYNQDIIKNEIIEDGLSISLNSKPSKSDQNQEETIKEEILIYDSKCKILMFDN